DREVWNWQQAHLFKGGKVAGVIAGEYDPVRLHLHHELIQRPAFVSPWQRHLQHHSSSADDQVEAVCKWAQALVEVTSSIRLAPESGVRWGGAGVPTRPPPTRVSGSWPRV